MVEVLVAVPAHRRVAADDHVRPDPSDDTREVAPQRDGRLDDAVLIPEKDDVLHAEDLGGGPRLALADRDQPGVVGRVLVGAGAAGRDQTEHDVSSLTRPAADAAGDRELAA